MEPIAKPIKKSDDSFSVKLVELISLKSAKVPSDNGKQKKTCSY